jgi:hypothetical protein
MSWGLFSYPLLLDGSAHELIARMLQTWTDSILHPTSFLPAAFEPGSKQIFDGLLFYLGILVLSALLHVPIALLKDGSFADKTTAMISAIVGLIYGIVATVAWYFAFALLGGKSNFAGTVLTYIYAVGPYLPLMILTKGIFVVGLPADFRSQALKALNPATGWKIVIAAKDHHQTSATAILAGSLMTFGLATWSGIVMLWCLSVVHVLWGWKFVGAILLSVVFMIPVGLVLMLISLLFFESHAGRIGR